MSSAYLRLLIFLPTILIPACASPSPAIPIMYSACNLNKNRVTIYSLDVLLFWFEPVCCSMSSFNYCSWPAYRILRRQVRKSGIPIFWRIFHSCYPHRQSLWRGQGSRCFSGTLLVFLWSNRCWQFDFWFFCLLKSSWKFSVKVLLKPYLEYFDHYFASLRWVQLWVSLNILWHCPSLG